MVERALDRIRCRPARRVLRGSAQVQRKGRGGGRSPRKLRAAARAETAGKRPRSRSGHNRLRRPDGPIFASRGVPELTAIAEPKAEGLRGIRASASLRALLGSEQAVLIAMLAA